MNPFSTLYYRASQSIVQAYLEKASAGALPTPNEVVDEHVTAAIAHTFFLIREAKKHPGNPHLTAAADILCTRTLTCCKTLFPHLTQQRPTPPPKNLSETTYFPRTILHLATEAYVNLEAAHADFLTALKSGSLVKAAGAAGAVLSYFTQVDALKNAMTLPLYAPPNSDTFVWHLQAIKISALAEKALAYKAFLDSSLSEILEQSGCPPLEGSPEEANFVATTAFTETLFKGTMAIISVKNHSMNHPHVGTHTETDMRLFFTTLTIAFTTCLEAHKKAGEALQGTTEEAPSSL